MTRYLQIALVLVFAFGGSWLLNNTDSHAGTAALCLAALLFGVMAGQQLERGTR